MGLCWFAGKTILRKRQGNSLHPQRCLKVKSRLAEMLQEIVLLLSEGLSQSLHQFSLSPPDLVEGTIERSPGTQQRKWEMPQGSRFHRSQSSEAYYELAHRGEPGVWVFPECLSKSCQLSISNTWTFFTTGSQSQ